MNKVVFLKYLLFLLSNFLLFLRIPVNQTLAQRQSSSDVLQIVANPAWEGDYFVKDVQKNKNLVYLSSKFNSGRITALFSPNGNRNIVNNISSGPQKPTGAFYNHFIIWQGNDTWSDGVLKTSGDFQVIKPYSSQNGYVEWSGKWTNDEVGFVSSLSQKVVEAAYNDLPILVIKNRTTFTATKDINNFRHLYVELGWTANDYRTLTAKTTQGVKLLIYLVNLEIIILMGIKLALVLRLLHTILIIWMLRRD